MCGPALPILAAGLSVAGTAVGTIQAIHQAQYQRQVAQAQAASARDAAREAQDDTARALADHYRAMGQTEGQQRLRAAAGGVSVDFGTAADAVESTRTTGTEQAQGLVARGASALRQSDGQAALAMGRASAAGAQGQSALFSGLVDMGQSVLSGARQYAALRSKIG